ncbi:M48 family metallopeptidase [Halobellus limi]|uniref:Heat shock protein HtpX n=1 Tax=Halobellus limi TaxID=699433 RepID=A0A1H6AK45_9EURY|nr:M48 family metalloprotease [Halobellus limi]QCC47614.1 peptidase M48 [Halobellus limi]SEG48610.1 heat shock protein HtpX [Halobellus limi]
MSAPPSGPREGTPNRRQHRILTAVAGVVALLVYGALAAGSLAVLSALWKVRVDPVAAGVGLLVGTLVVAYLSVRVGTRRVLDRIDAREMPEPRLPGVYALLDDLAASMAVDRPRLLVARLDAPNAFALETAGRRTVVLNASLFDLLDRAEFEALLAHELAHLERRDGFVGTVALSLSQLVVIALELLLSPAVFLLTGTALFVAWNRGDPYSWPDTLPGRVRRAVETSVAVVGMTATLLFRAYSRRREYAADERAAEVTGRPLALASALRKLDRAASREFGSLSPVWTHGEVESEEERRLREVFSTHPRIEDRIAKLRELADEGAASVTRVPIE